MTSLPHASGKAVSSGLPERRVSPSRERGGIGIHVASGKVKSKVDVQYKHIATFFVAIRAVRYALIIKRSLNQRDLAARRLPAQQGLFSLKYLHFLAAPVLCRLPFLPCSASIKSQTCLMQITICST